MVPTEDMCWRTVRGGMGWNFGRTDLKKSESEAKSDARARSRGIEWANTAPRHVGVVKSVLGRLVKLLDAALNH